jgi:hypothetical protein
MVKKYQKTFSDLRNCIPTSDLTQAKHESVCPFGRKMEGKEKKRNKERKRFKTQNTLGIC